MDRRLALTLPLSSLALLGAALAPSWLGTPTPAAPDPAPATPPTVVAAGVSFTAEADRTVTDPLSREVRVRVSLAAAPDGPAVRRPTDLVLVVDRSGSMSGTKIEDARAAARALIGQLHPEDRVALVSFATDARVDLGLAHPDERWVGLVDGLQAGGSTDLQEGLLVAQGLAAPTPGRTTRMVVLSDGHPDQRWDALAPTVAAIAGRDVVVSAVGIGEDWDESLMRALADSGTGNLHWVRQGPDLSRALGAELEAAGRVVAEGATLRIDGPATVLGAGGYATDGGRVRLGAVSAGQDRDLWVTLRLDGATPGPQDPGALVLSLRTPDGRLEEQRIDLPPVTVAADAAVAFATLGDTWARGVVQEAWNETRQDVAAHVQRGDDAGALAALHRYQAQLTLANGYADNPIVDDNLSAAAALEAELRTVVADPALRNGWSKGNVVSATQQRKGR
jgi:hypothetical protein